MAVTIEVKIDNTNTILENLVDVKKRALMRSGATLESYAKQDAPVDTGRLRNSIHHEMENDDTVNIGTDVEYAKFQELGTSRGVSAKLFLTNAGKLHIDEYIQIIANEFKNG